MVCRIKRNTQASYYPGKLSGAQLIGYKWLPFWGAEVTNIPVRGRVVVLNCQRSRYADWWIWSYLNRRAFLKCLWLSFLHRSCWESWSCNFRIAFLDKLWKDWALIRMGHGYISSGSEAGIFEVRTSIFWCQFQLKLDWVTRRRLIAACLVSFFSSNRRGQIQ